jgi:murein DD-endopeptidase MepM/ murein hydrolase activator NlpD
MLRGQQIGFSGNTANKPHVHLSAASCDPVTFGTANCPTPPVNFRNTDPNPRGLDQGRTYTAMAY